MRRRPLTLLCAMAVGTMAAAAPGPFPAAGTWTAVSDGLGGELTLVLQVQGSSVTGEGRQSRGALQPVVLQVSGRYRPPVLELRLRSGDGLVRTLTTRILGPETMAGTLTGPGATVEDLRFARP